MTYSTRVLEANLILNEDGTYSYSESNFNGWRELDDALLESGLQEVFATVHNLPKGAVILGTDDDAQCIIMWEVETLLLTNPWSKEVVEIEISKVADILTQQGYDFDGFEGKELIEEFARRFGEESISEIYFA